MNGRSRFLKGLGMLEIRWVRDDQGYIQLQQRKRELVSGSAGGFSRFTAWSDWEAVPIVQDFFEFKEVKEVTGTNNVNPRG